MRRSNVRTEPRKIALVLPFPTPSGRELTELPRFRRESALAGELRARGFAVEGFKATRGSERVSSVDDSGTPWHFLPAKADAAPALSEDAQGAAHLLRSPHLVQEVSAWQPDVVLVKGAGTRIGQDLAQRTDAYFGVIIGGRFKDASLFDCDVILTETVAQDRYLSRFGLGRRLLRLPKLPHAAFLSEVSRTDLELSYDIAVVSKFVASKNHQALEPLFDHPLRIVMMGDGPLRTTLEQAAAGRTAEVVFTGNVSQSDVAGFVGRSRLLVHPARYEGFPRALVEAMALGVPAISLRGVVGEPIIHGKNGLLVPEGDLVRETLRVLDDASELRILGENAKRTQQSHFTLAALQRTADSLAERIRTDSRAHASRPIRCRRGSSIRVVLWRSWRPVERAVKHLRTAATPG